MYGIWTVNLGLWEKIPSFTSHQMGCPGRINSQFRELLLTWNGVVCLSAKIGLGLPGDVVGVGGAAGSEWLQRG